MNTKHGISRSMRDHDNISLAVKIGPDSVQEDDDIQDQQNNCNSRVT